jgi:hypothetical protein
MSTEARRSELVAAIPWWYHGYAAFVLINAVHGAGIVLMLQALDRPSWKEWLLLPAFFVFANGVEWWVHRGPMHHPRPGLMMLYRRHALEHHLAFTSDRMEFRSHRELKLVLFPPLFFPFLLLITSPVPVALWLLSGGNLALLFLVSAFAYYLVYEWFHTVHHCPRRSWLGQTIFARLVRGHHTRHHDLRRMTQGNFNVSFPLWDWLLGSTLSWR